MAGCGRCPDGSCEAGNAVAAGSKMNDFHGCLDTYLNDLIQSAHTETDLNGNSSFTFPLHRLLPIPRDTKSQLHGDLENKHLHRSTSTRGSHPRRVSRVLLEPIPAYHRPLRCIRCIRCISRLFLVPYLQIQTTTPSHTPFISDFGGLDTHKPTSACPDRTFPYRPLDLIPIVNHPSKV
ncbi:uncharacterized protein CLUP02_10256 [Colletotrichum lupini]|uniref:Uncharacterized protein n=1 Tax=Colletotrichum lupini TaxID=145971 RepID=A0A9Q8SX69_9PEZI|nr:uncharacterized protein CLUP02_10256 [Colletotrichum lupini]UQC84760.1 hypothetical protein CLUP02_10256 [Colletotrichum lupini]